jgi:hypothetical protein
MSTGYSGQIASDDVNGFSSTSDIYFMGTSYDRVARLISSSLNAALICCVSTA